VDLPLLDIPKVECFMQKSNDRWSHMAIRRDFAQPGGDMQFIGLKNCDTCRKALKSLAVAGHRPDVTDVRADAISATDIAAIVSAFGDKAVNRASTTWRGLSDVEKEADPAILLAAHPTLLKRPAIELDGEWTIGWKADVQAKYLGT
jgi:arsenate reductase-like glutaredoxin family protein